MEQARAYNRAKNIKMKSCPCADCGKAIEWSGANCVEFGVYVCLKCRIKRAAFSNLRNGQQ